jgi:hypothetical protein
MVACFAQLSRAAGWSDCPALGNAEARPMDQQTDIERDVESVEPQGPASLRRDSPHSAMQVRAADLQPYSGLRYLAKLFRLMALVVVVLMVAETLAGLSMHGAEALVTLLSEAARWLVLAGVLWGSGDLATLLIDIGHDVRATRILTGRRAAHEWQDQPHPGRDASSAAMTRVEGVAD